jgi:hypothetical protein
MSDTHVQWGTAVSWRYSGFQTVMNDMLLPHVWLRKLWLRRALRGYPLYDPPHKVEEYLLTRERALENFNYFMSVREVRVAYFTNWLSRNFQTVIAPTEEGVRALNVWGNRFAGLLLTPDAKGNAKNSYFTYDPPWVGEEAGLNVLFDLGITLGEFIVSNCPRLHWDVDPISEVLPRTGKMLKKSPGMSFQRPMLSGFGDPVATANPLHRVWGFAYQMNLYFTNSRGIKRYYRQPKFARENIRWQILNIFKSVSKSRQDSDPLRAHMPLEEYLKLIDGAESEDGGD